MCVHVHSCVCVCAKCEHTLIGFVICGSFASVCLNFLCVNMGLNVCVCVCRISLCVCMFVTASVQVHGDMLFTASLAARLHDDSQHRGGGKIAMGEGRQRQGYIAANWGAVKFYVN